jgi:branched-chain amino acid transport system permease protein
MKRLELIAALVVTVALAAVPLVSPSAAMMNFMTYALIVALAAQGWNVLGGFGGQFSFGHAAFFGTGAYVMALAQVRFSMNPWLALPLAIVAGALVGLIIGTLSFRARLRGSYFALVTLAFAEVMRIVVNAWAFTGGAAGVLIPLRLTPGNFQFEDRRALYGVALGFVVATLVLTFRLLHTRLGAQLAAVRENEDAARALGVNVLAVKLKAITLSAAITSAAGCL